MTAFVVNGGATTLWDSLAGGSVNATLDSYAISNNTTLKIDTDTYQCAGHSTAFGSVDTVTFSGTGGKLLVDPTGTKCFAYTGGSGNVPAIGATISQGGVSGTFLGVWATWLVEPTASGAAMPATGFIKVKNITGGAFAGGALTGITATASEAQRQSWIEIRGADTAAITVPRIGAFEVVEAWFELGTTNGTRGQVLACPTTATVAGVFGGCWIETSAGSGVYEEYIGVGSTEAAAAIPTDADRGKIVWQTTSGIRIGSDGTNNVGFLPPTGCKVRIPASIFTCCTRTAGGSGPRVLPNATLATRQEFRVTASGDISINSAVMQWYCNFLQAYRTKVHNSIISDTLVIQEVSAPIDLSHVIVSPTQAQLNSPLNMQSCFGGGTIDDCYFGRFSLASANSYVNVFNYNKDITFNRVKTTTLLNRGNATTGTWTCIQNIGCTWNDCLSIGGRSLNAGSQRTTFNNYRYADLFSGTTGTGNAHYAIDLTTGCNTTVLDGFSSPVTNTHPYSGILSAAACYDTTVRDIGTNAVNYNMGSANASGVLFNGGGNNDGIKLQNIYVVNTRTGPWSFVNSDNNVTIQDFYSDFAGTSVIAALNCTAKSVGLTGATTGQTAVYGTHWKSSFTSATVGKIEILCNEPTVTSAAQCFVSGGTPRFNSAGQVALTVIGDQVTWEMPFFAKNMLTLANLAPTLTGTNTGNMTYEFQYDKTGSGYNGSWLTLNAANLSGAGAIDPVIGVKLKVRATCSVTAAANLLTNIAIPTTTDAGTYKANSYPQVPPTTFVLTNLNTGVEVRITQGSTSLDYNSNVTNGTYTYSYYYSTDTIVTVSVGKQGYIRNTFTVTLGSTNQSFPITLDPDPSYI